MPVDDCGAHTHRFLGGGVVPFADRLVDGAMGVAAISVCPHWVTRFVGVSGGVIRRWAAPSPPGFMVQASSSSLCRVILEWVHLGMVETSSSLTWVSRLFLFPKREYANLRLILD